MSTGQFVYNLEDYAGMGGLVSTDLTTKQPALNESFALTKNPKIDIYKNIFESPDSSSKGGGIDVKNVTKIGIQAPPGTQFYLNADPPTEDEAAGISTTIMVGRTGIYELEVPNMNISILSFVQPKNYVLDIDISQKYIDDGRALMSEAKDNFDKAYEELKPTYDTAVSVESNKDFWEEYERIHDEYVVAYESARAKYIQGIAGVYREGNDGDLYNIIIDYKYDTINEGVG